MELGQMNYLGISRKTEFGYYLIDEGGAEVLLPNNEITELLNIGDKINVFIYRDSEGRLISTRKKPKVLLNQFAFLQVKAVTRVGAFVDWGLQKDLFVPFAQQARRMEERKRYLVYMLLDEQTDRLIATSKVEKFMKDADEEIKVGDEVSVLAYRKSELGYHCVMNNEYRGLIFHSSIHKNIFLGDRLVAFVSGIREDDKIDLALEPIGYKMSIDVNSKAILDALRENDGFISLTDKSDPEEINYELGLSKKAFKRALGNLYKQRIVDIKRNGIKLLKDN